MKNHDQNNNPPLHLHDDPEHLKMESLLDSLGDRERESMPDGLESRVLDSIGRAIAPAPIAIESTQAPASVARFSSIRFAAAAALLFGATVVIWSAQPWASSSNTPGLGELTLAASIDQDLDAFFALESLDDDDLAEAVTDWEIWAESVDTDMDTTLAGYDWYESVSEDGAL